jgi:integrase
MAGSKRERSPGTWELRVSLGRDPLTHKPRYATRTVHTTSVRSADRLLAEFVTEIGRTNRRAAPAKGPKTVAEMMAAWLDHISDGLTLEQMAAQPMKGSMSPQTVYVYRGIIDRHIVPSLGHLRLAKLTTFEVDAFYRALLKGRAKSTVRKVANVLTKALDQAVTWGFLLVNPAKGAKKPVPAKPDIKAPSPEVVLQLIAGANAAGNRELATIILAAADSGMRRGEVCALRWQDVDWSTGQARISHAIGSVPGSPAFEKDTKTHQVRTVTFSPITLLVLEDYHRRRMELAAKGGVELHPTAYLFPASGSIDGTMPKRPDVVSTAYSRLCASLGIKGQRFHGTRHFTGTQLAAAGLPVVEIAARLGHADSSTTLRSYVHTLDAGDVRAAGLMGAVLDHKRETAAVQAAEATPDGG